MFMISIESWQTTLIGFVSQLFLYFLGGTMSGDRAAWFYLFVIFSGVGFLITTIILFFKTTRLFGAVLSIVIGLYYLFLLLHSPSLEDSIISVISVLFFFISRRSLFPEGEK